VALKLYYGIDSDGRARTGDESWREEVWEHEGEPRAVCGGMNDALITADEEGAGVYFVYDGDDCIGAIYSIHAPRLADRVGFYAHEGAVELVRDVTDELRMRADAHAGIYRVGGMYAHAGGEGAVELDGLGARVVALEPWGRKQNTADDWLEWFPSLAEAEAHHQAVVDAVGAGTV
jgi:hypothetical protein